MSGTRRILIVDDAASIRTMVRAVLERAGYEVVTARNGCEAIALLVNNDYDVVLLDAIMPKLDGRSVVEQLRSENNPVLAHMFLNYMLDLQNVLTNISWNGYMQPLTGVTPQRLVKEQILPPSLMSTAVLPSFFRRGVMELQIPVATNLLWEQSWQAASKGV